MTNFFRLKPSDPDFHRLFDRSNIDHFKVYTRDRSLIGQVQDTWVDDAGRYYLVVDRQLERGNQQVLVPISRFQIDSHGHQIHTELDSAQAVSLPLVTAEGIVRGANQPIANPTVANQAIASQTTLNPAAASDGVAAGTRTFVPLEASAPLEGSAPLDVPAVNKEVQRVVMANPEIAAPAPVRPSPEPLEPPTLAPAPAPEVLARPAEPIAQPVTPARTAARIAQEEKVRLLEERLVVNARRQKIGDVIVRKEIITEMVQVPIRREKLIVEQISPERKQLVEVDLHQGDRSTIELIESLHANSNLSGSATDQPLTRSSSNGQASLMSIRAASELLAELADRPEYQGGNVRIEFADPGLQAEYQRRSRQS